MTHTSCFESLSAGRRPRRPAFDERRGTRIAPLFGGAVAMWAMALCAALATQAEAVCVGDCDRDGRVRIAEVQACVNLGHDPVLPAPACAAADQNLDGTVDPNEVDACILAFLDAATCPMVFTPTPTPTVTNTMGPPTATATPTPTPTIAEIACNLAAASGIQIHIAALPVPLAFPLAGSIAIGTALADANGDSPASCSVTDLNPVNIPSIGFVCISPGGNCAVGKRDCDGGTPLGIDVQSDGNAGSCTSNTACQSICTTQCGAAGNVLAAQCTGYCTEGDEGACTSDDQCMTPPSDGACNGPNPVTAANKNLCQCTCVNSAAHGASEPGDLQCNLGSSLVVETGAPCGGGDVLINVGSTCIPVTTQRASSIINDSNFSPGSTVPGVGIVNDLEGTTVACAALDAGMVFGIQGVGAVNFFGSALGDLAVGLKAQCQ